jgi:hypothetical protein
LCHLRDRLGARSKRVFEVHCIFNAFAVEGA